MSDFSATAVANANIALIKYWGNRDQKLRLPANGSISMNLDGLFTRSTVTFSPEFKHDTLKLNGKCISGVGLDRVAQFLDIVRQLANRNWSAQVISENNFPMDAGLASSASAFAALSMAATVALGLNLSEADLSRLARRGSGSACRSIPAGFVEWQAGTGDLDSYASSIAPPGYWELVDCIAMVQTSHKPISSTEGHGLADSSPLQSTRIADAPHRLDFCRKAILERDFAAFAEIVEHDSNLMHAVMMTSRPALFYWEPPSLHLMKTIPIWRAQGLPVCYTLDAGANVHVLTIARHKDQVKKRLKDQPGVMDVLCAAVGEAAHIEK